jgi:hypothetical protein
MALDQMVGIDFGDHMPSANATCFLLGRNSGGAWVLREVSGRRGGLFCSRDAAVKYACDENRNGSFTILHMGMGLELEEARAGRAA